MSDPPKPPSVVHSHSNFTALLGADQVGSSEGRRTSGGRRKKEKKQLSSTDGRVRRGLGRDRQFKTNVTQDLIDSLEGAVDRFDLTKAEFTERAFRFYIKALEDGSAT